MKTNTAKISGLVLGIAVMIALSGCAGQQYSKANRTESVIEMSSSKNIKLLWADSHQADDTLIIHGALRRMHSGSAPMTAHVDVQILTDDGQVLQEARTPDMAVPRNQPGKSGKIERFEVVLNNVSAEDVTIVLSAHQGSDDV